MNFAAIIKKLDKEQLISYNAHGLSGAFSLKKHSNLLDPYELKEFVDLLHKASHCGQTCTDMHYFKFQFLDD